MFKLLFDPVKKNKDKNNCKVFGINDIVCGNNIHEY